MRSKQGISTYPIIGSSSVISKTCQLYINTINSLVVCWVLDAESCVLRFVSLCSVSIIRTGEIIELLNI